MWCVREGVCVSVYTSVCVRWLVRARVRALVHVIQVISLEKIIFADDTKRRNI